MAQDTTEPKLTFRRMVESDLDSVVHVENEANAFGWKRRTFVESLRNGYECWVVDEPLTQGFTVAHAVLGFAVDSAELYNISVSPHYQGRRIGSELFDHMLHVARTRSINSVFLEVRVSNDRAIQLYTSRGFSKVGLRKGYYRHQENGREDGLVLRLPIYTEQVG